MPTSSRDTANKENISPNPPSDTPALETDEKKAKKQCTWTLREKGLMLDVLAVEKAAGNQSESGWKASVWEKVAEKLAKEGDEMFPVKTATKCQDAFTKMKTDFRLIKELLGAPGGGSSSGFGWDDGTKKVVATEPVWAAKIKVNNKYAKFKKQAFPHYDAMADLVDGIIATGAGAFNPGDSPPTSPIHVRSSSPSPLPNDDPAFDETPTPTPTPAPAVSRKRQRAASDPPASKAPRPHKRPNGKDKDVTEGYERLAKALEFVGSQLHVEEPDYHTRAIEIMEGDMELSEEEMVSALAVFDNNPNCAKSYCNTKSKVLRTNYIRKRISEL